MGMRLEKVGRKRCKKRVWKTGKHEGHPEDTARGGCGAGLLRKSWEYQKKNREVPQEKRGGLEWVCSFEYSDE